jgi:hypothetical protein
MWNPDRNQNFLYAVQTGFGAHPAHIHWVRRVKRPEREANDSPTSAEVKKTWIYTSTPSYFMA